MRIVCDFGTRCRQRNLCEEAEVVRSAQVRILLHRQIRRIDSGGLCPKIKSIDVDRP